MHGPVFSLMSLARGLRTPVAPPPTATGCYPTDEDNSVRVCGRPEPGLLELVNHGGAVLSGDLLSAAALVEQQ